MAELLAPAGDLERLKWAAEYGADAVYFGTHGLSLRSFAGNFDYEEAEEGLKYLHARGKRGYVTLNIYPFSDEYSRIIDAAKVLSDMHADAFIVADFGVFYELKKLGLNTPLHISTQANTTSWQTALSYSELGAKRINLARELSLEQIREIRNNTTGKVEIEAFIHGSVCFSYSGRCAISDYMAARRGNRGECAQPCRWGYHLVEEERPGEYMPVFEDERGFYLMNSKDLALFEFVPELMEMGVDSFKIEGRMKKVHYLAQVLSLYRKIMDGEHVETEKAWDMLFKVNNRGYSYGFITGGTGPEDYDYEKGRYRATTTVVAHTTENTHKGMRELDVKNTVEAGETLETLAPGGIVSTYTLPESFVTPGGDTLERANNQDTVLIPDELPPFVVLRRPEA